MGKIYGLLSAKPTTKRLYTTGYYRVRAHAYTKDEDAVLIAATPIKLWQRESEGTIKEIEKAYYTKLFPIQYCDEEVDISEGVVFGFEVNLATSQTQRIYVELSLLFSEKETPDDLSEAAYQCIQIENPHYGHGSFFKLTFDSFHFSTLNVSLLSAMIDIKRGVCRRDWQKCAPVLPVRAFTPKAPPSLKYISKQSKTSKKEDSVESKLNAVYDPERNFATVLDADAPAYVHGVLGSVVETDGYRPPKPGEWSDPTFHDFLCLFESESLSKKNVTRITDIGEIMKVRVDLVAERFQQLLLRNYFVLSALTYTLCNRALSKPHLRKLAWITGLPPLRLPGGYTMFVGVNGLPDVASIRGPKDASLPVTRSISLYINKNYLYDPDAHECPNTEAGWSEDFLQFYVPFCPVSSRPKIRENKKTLISDLQSVLSDDVNLFWCQISEKWHKLCMLVSLASKETCFFFELMQSEMEHRQLSSLFRREVCCMGTNHLEPDPAHYHTSVAENYRKTVSAASEVSRSLLIESKVEDCHEGYSLKTVPLIFEELYGFSSESLAAEYHLNSRSQERCTSVDWTEDNIPGEHSRSLKSFNQLMTHLDPKPYEGLHLVILVHGFKGNSFDLRIFKNYLQRLFPEHIYLLSSCNEGKSDDDISVQGGRLCSEILKYVDDLCSWESIGRVSFVSHSLGGLITRTAIPLLLNAANTTSYNVPRADSMRKKLHLYMSLSTPHLGYTAARNKFVDAGLWVLKKWKRSQALSQLCMCDAKDYRETFLYKLSENEALDHFEHLYFISSPQDNYVPYESARCEVSERVMTDPAWSDIYNELIAKIFAKERSFVRLDVSFKIQNKNLDSLIGRTAHINFLSSEILARMITTRYAHIFL